MDRSLAGTRAGTEAGGLMSEFGGDDTEVDDMADDEEGSADVGVDLKQRWREQQDDVMFPDEVRDVASSPSLPLYNGHFYHSCPISATKHCAFQFK